MGGKSEVAKKGQVAVAGIVSPVVVLLHPTRNFLDTPLHRSLHIPGITKHKASSDCAQSLCC